MKSWIDFRENGSSPLTKIKREYFGELRLVWKEELGNYHVRQATALVGGGGRSREVSFD
ncbi:MAG TPA: hypothetical protein VIS55_03515 [Pseudomonadales bacterium]|jgi:hypothetical protein